jgi:hypothetical protein
MQTHRRMHPSPKRLTPHQRPSMADGFTFRGMVAETKSANLSTQYVDNYTTFPEREKLYHKQYHSMIQKTPNRALTLLALPPSITMPQRLEPTIAKAAQRGIAVIRQKGPDDSSEPKLTDAAQ